jgi:hypothetical protein
MSKAISDTLLLDIAVIAKEFSPIQATCTENHVIELDEILIDKASFTQIFYPNGNNFGIDHTKLQILRRSKPKIAEYISFSPPLRSINNGEPFALLEQILLNIEADLNITRNCFEKTSLIELSKELSSVKSLADLNCCNVLTSLNWNNIITILKNEYVNRSSTNPLNQALLVISVIFKTTNLDILPTLVKFKYRIVENCFWN